MAALPLVFASDAWVEAREVWGQISVAGQELATVATLYLTPVA